MLARVSDPIATVPKLIESFLKYTPVFLGMKLESFTWTVAGTTAAAVLFPCRTGDTICWSCVCASLDDACTATVATAAASSSAGEGEGEAGESLRAWMNCRISTAAEVEVELLLAVLLRELCAEPVRLPVALPLPLLLLAPAMAVGVAAVGAGAGTAEAKALRSSSRVSAVEVTPSEAAEAALTALAALQAVPGQVGSVVLQLLLPVLRLLLLLTLCAVTVGEEALFRRAPPDIEAVDNEAEAGEADLMLLLLLRALCGVDPVPLEPAAAAAA
jgi:hypothetical protein